MAAIQDQKNLMSYPKCPKCMLKLENLGGLLECPNPICGKKYTLKEIGDNPSKFHFNKKGCILF